MRTPCRPGHGGKGHLTLDVLATCDMVDHTKSRRRPTKGHTMRPDAPHSFHNPLFLLVLATSPAGTLAQATCSETAPRNG